MEDLAVNNLERLTCIKINQPTNQSIHYLKQKKNKLKIDE